MKLSVTVRLKTKRGWWGRVTEDVQKVVLHDKDDNKPVRLTGFELEDEMDYSPTGLLLTLYYCVGTDFHNLQNVKYPGTFLNSVVELIVKKD